MIKAIISGIFKLIISLVNMILLPIDNLIGQFMPGLSSTLDTISDFFDMLGDVVPFICSYTGLNTEIFNAVVAIITFILTVPFMVSTIKTALAWYDKLKP